VILRGEPKKEQSASSPAVLADHDAILLANTVEQLLAAAPGRERIAIFEFRTTKAVRLFDHTSSSGQSRQEALRCATRSSKYMKTLLPPDVSQRDDRNDSDDLAGITSRRFRKASNYIRWFAQAIWNVIVDIFSNRDSVGHDWWAHGEEGSGHFNAEPGDLANKLVFQRRFAAGQAFTPDFFGSVLGHIYHFPTTIEFVETMTMPQRRGQSNYPWQVHCPPEWIGRTFRELTQAWLTNEEEVTVIGPVLILAIYKRSNEAERSQEYSSEDGSAFAYNVTLPSPATVLYTHDLLTVLAGKQFGQVMAQRGLLRGSDEADNGDAVANPIDEIEAALPHSMSIHSMESIAEDLSEVASILHKVEV